MLDKADLSPVIFNTGFNNIILIFRNKLCCGVVILNWCCT